jgi:hypothetical protein
MCVCVCVCVCVCYTRFTDVLHFCFSCSFMYHKQPCVHSWFCLQIAQTHSQNSLVTYGSGCGQAAFSFHQNSALTESNSKMLRCVQTRSNVAFTNFKTGNTATWSVELQLHIEQEPGSIFDSQSSHADWGVFVFCVILTQTVVYAGYFKYATTLPLFFHLQLLDLSSYSSQLESILERVGFISIQVPDHNFVPEG